MARPLLRRVLTRIGGALFAPGLFIPAVTKVVRGETVIVSPEVVRPKGILRSKTVWGGIVAAAFAFANSQGWTLGIDADDAQTILGFIAAGGGLGAVISRILAWMPTRGPTGGG